VYTDPSSVPQALGNAAILWSKILWINTCHRHSLALKHYPNILSGRI